MDDIAALNAKHHTADGIAFAAGPGGLPCARLSTEAATATICLHGAHVMAYQPCHGRPVLWMSAASQFAPGKPIRGGIPVCWPWFGAHPQNPDLPAHGFARLQRWEVEAAQRLDARTARLILALDDSAGTRRIWDHAFSLRLEVTVGDALEVSLSMTNTDTAPWTITAALHTYFAVSDVTAVAVHGFDGCPSVDTVGGARVQGVQRGPVLVRAETDLVLLGCSGEAMIDDPGWKRRLRIRKEGSLSAVVWNPWIAKSKRMPDFGDDEYPAMICVETTNARGDERLVQPGRTHCLKATIDSVPCPADRL